MKRNHNYYDTNHKCLICYEFTKRALVMMTNNVLYLKPTWSYKIPATDGPTNDPRANVDVHNPETRPYVERLLGNP